MLKSLFLLLAMVVGSTSMWADNASFTNGEDSYSVTWRVNGSEYANANYAEGASIAFPSNPEAINGKDFVGWSATEIVGITNENPTLVTSATMETTPLTFFAVFARKTIGQTVTVTDELTNATTGVGATMYYSDWSGKTASSSAVYAGSSAGGGTTETIQLRSTENSGIITTTSGGKAKKITVNWYSSTKSGRTLDVYGNNTAYKATSELYNNNKPIGTKLGSIVKGTSTTLTITGDYAYIGLRSNNEAMYINKISIEWETVTPDTYSDYCTAVPTTATITLNAACNDGSMVYGTYSSARAFVVSNDIVVSEISVTNDRLEVYSYSTGDIVPANTGVMVSALEGGDYTVQLAIGGTSILGNDNMLKPTGDNGISADDMNAANTKFYRLTMHNGTQIGYWWGAENGAAFALAANKAYLAVPSSANARIQSLWFDNETTDVDDVRSKMDDVRGKVFDLQGRRVVAPQKGLYIQNGRKFVIR